MQVEQNTNRSAFLLNANAKNVSDRVLNDLVGVIPAGDLFYALYGRFTKLHALSSNVVTPNSSLVVAMARW